MSTDYDYSNNTPIAQGVYSVFKSGYKNIRFALTTTQTYTIKQADMANLVGLAYTLYGDVSLWYALLAFNGLQDPIQEIYPGLILNIPSKSDVIAYLSKQKNEQVTSFVI